MKTCSVAWCAAIATTGDKCPVHAKHPTLRPDVLSADEEFCDEREVCDECAVWRALFRRRRVNIRKRSDVA